MSLNQDDILKLTFLKRVIEKEIDLVEYAAQEAFAESLEISKIEALDKYPELALKFEAFTSRFCRLQDTVGDKMLPAVLKMLEEPKSPVLDNLNKAESYGWLASAQEWLALRQLRNQMVHEYIEDSELFLSALVTAYNNIETLKQFGYALIAQVDKRIKV